jgi:aquaporin Z
MNDVNDCNNAKYLKYRSKFSISEFFGTALLLLGGLSIVIFMFGSGSPMAQLIPGVKLLFVFIGFKQIRQLTPYMFPLLYAIMVPLEADISGISTNPARSLGPAVISGQWTAFWIYIAGPLTGALLASVAGSMFAKRITIAKLYHFDSESEGDILLRKKAS